MTIVVTGSVRARPDTAAEIGRLSLEHVRRSRAEPGCLSHGVYHDVEDELRFVFVERWTDMAALHAHFAVPESRAFAKALASLADGAPDLQLYDATEVRP